MPTDEDEPNEGDCSDLLDPRLAMALRIWTLQCIETGAATYRHLRDRLQKPKTGESPK